MFWVRKRNPFFVGKWHGFASVALKEFPTRARKVGYFTYLEYKYIHPSNGRILEILSPFHRLGERCAVYCIAAITGFVIWSRW